MPAWVPLQALKNAGCTEVVLAINYQPKVRLMSNVDLCSMQPPGTASWHTVQHAAAAGDEWHTCCATT